MSKLNFPGDDYRILTIAFDRLFRTNKSTLRFWIISCEVMWRSEPRLPSRILLFLYSKQYCFKPQKNPKIRRQVSKINISGHGKGHKLISIGIKSFFLDFSRWRTKHSVMADALLSLPGRTKVRKTSLPLASTRSFLVKKPPQAPLQQQGEEGVRLKSGSTLREDEFLEELEQQQERKEGIVLENTYRVAPDPQKKFSPGLFFY